MDKTAALKVQSEFESLCKKYGLWFTIEREEKPDLKMIRIKEISIKVDKEKN